MHVCAAQTSSSWRVLDTTKIFKCCCAFLIAAVRVCLSPCLLALSQVVFRDPVRYKLQKVLTVAAEGTYSGQVRALWCFFGEGGGGECVWCTNAAAAPATAAAAAAVLVAADYGCCGSSRSNSWRR